MHGHLARALSSSLMIVLALLIKTSSHSQENAQPSGAISTLKYFYFCNTEFWRGEAWLSSIIGLKKTNQKNVIVDMLILSKCQ